VKVNPANYKVATMCRALGVSRSGYYALLYRSPLARSIEDAQLTRRIEAIHKTSRETYGVPRIHAELIEDDERVSRKRIARLMRDQGLQGVCRRKRVTTTVRDARDRVVPDLVDRDFYASAPDEL